MGRDLSRARRPAAPATSLLSDLARLPLEAAVDMVCAGLQAPISRPAVASHRAARGGTAGGAAAAPRSASPRRRVAHHGIGLGPLPELVARIEETSHAEPERAAGAAARVLGAAARAGGLGGGAADVVTRLAQVALLGGDDAVLARLTAALLAEPTQLGTALQAPLTQRCRRDGLARAAVIDAAAAWFAQGDTVWREHGGADARDGLTSTLVEQAVARADLDQACAVARLWPPMRTALTRLGSALAGARRIPDLDRLAAPYKPGGPLSLALLEVVASVAASDGTRGEEVAAWLFRVDPNPERFALARSVTDSRLWPARRAALVGLVLDTHDAPWLVDLLAAEPDAGDALLRLMRRHPRREQTVLAATAALRAIDPTAAFTAACAGVLTCLDGAGSNTHRLRSAVKCVRAAASALGEPQLAEAWLTLVRRELGDAASGLLLG